jgi:hypothetical protein
MSEDQARALGDAVARVRPNKSQPSKERNSRTGIRVAVATFPRAAADLSRELELVKSALLYADEVTICSANSTLLASLAAIAELNDDQKLKFIQEVAPAFRPELVERVATLRRFLSKRQQGGEGFRLALQARAGLDGAWKEVREHVARMLDSAGASELEPAIRQGLVRIDLLDLQQSSGDMARAYETRLQRYLSDPSMYSLFDDDTGRLVRAGREAGIFVISSSGERRATEAGLASGLIAELPTFPAADMDRILETRVAVEDHVARFRRSVNDLRGYLEKTALQEGFRDEVADIYTRDVQAAMEEIRVALKAPHVTRMILRAGLDATPLSGVFGLVAFEVGHLGPIASALVAGTSFALSAVNNQREQRLKRESEAAKNDLFFLYRANQQMG